MMIKKIAILFSIALIALGINAQLPVGGWTFHPTFNGVSSITETQGMVYYLSGSSLFSVDKNTNEIRSLNVANDLNGANISSIFAHPDGKYIIIVYTDNNMDRINDDGSVVNISDIRDAAVNGSSAIKHIGFGNGKYYVSTDFGLVTFDEKKNEARETMYTPSPVACAYGLGDKVVISYQSHLMAADASKKLVSIDQFSLVGNNTQEYAFSSKGLPIGNNRLLLVSTSNTPVVAHFDFENDRLIYFSGLGFSGVTGIFKMNNGQGVAVNATNAIIFTSTDDPTKASKLTLPTALKNNKISAIEGWDKTWAGSTAGLAEYDLTDFAAPVQLTDRFGATEFSAYQCCHIFAQPDNNSLYFWNPYKEAGIQFGNYNTNSALKLNSYSRENGFSNLNPTTQANGTAMGAINNPMWVAQDPRNPNRYYIACWSTGIYIVENSQIKGVINNTNSTLTSSRDYRVSYVGFDSFDNLWVLQETSDVFNAQANNNVHVISYADLTSGAIQKSMWRSFMGDVFRCSFGTPLKKSNRMAFARGIWNINIAFIDQKGTASIDDDEIIIAKTYIDQDNKPINHSNIGGMCEDAKGRLWVGTNNGVFEITDPSKVTSETVYVNHLKVPRNDGTGLADYLLDSQYVSCIACDASNRKWISTTTNGVYLVSENGDEILEHFTTENSILPSNRVWSVACDPNSSSVFIATDAGVVEYSSTSSPAMKNFNDVYAYPNPVRPEYTGWITVTGLMDNSLVKIADAAGNVFFQGRSEGGMITWDGCNAAGERVKTGVYFVFASHGTSNDSSSEGCVTKIMVVN